MPLDSSRSKSLNLGSKLPGGKIRRLVRRVTSFASLRHSSVKGRDSNVTVDDGQSHAYQTQLHESPPQSVIEIKLRSTLSVPIEIAPLVRTSSSHSSNTTASYTKGPMLLSVGCDSSSVHSGTAPTSGQSSSSLHSVAQPSMAHPSTSAAACVSEPSHEPSNAPTTPDTAAGVSPLRSGNVEEVVTLAFSSDIPEPSCLTIHPVREIALGSSRELDEAEGAVPMSLTELGPDPPKETEPISLLHAAQSLPHEQSEQPAVVASVQESSFPPAHASSQVIPTENVDEEVCLAEPALVPLPEQHLKLLSVEYMQLDNSARPDVSTIIGQLEMVQDIILSKDDSAVDAPLENVAVPLEAVEPTYSGPTLVCGATKAEVPIEQPDVALSNKETISLFHTLGPSLSDSVEVPEVAQLSQLPPVAALHSLNELGIHPQAAVSCTEKEPCAIELPPSPLLVPQTGECPSQEKLTYRPMLPLADSSSIVQAVLDGVVEVSRKTEGLSTMDLAQRPILPLADSSSAIESAVGPVVSQVSHAARHEVGRIDETILRLAAETHDTSSPIDVVARRTWKLEMGVTQKHIPVCVRAVHLTLGYSLTWWLSKSPMF